MKKGVIKTIREKNEIIENIIDAMVKRKNFLVLGHENPDEDCIASMVAFSLLLSKFQKGAKICLGKRVHEHYQYLLNICRYNAIQVYDTCNSFTDEFDTIVICDTPKPSMVESSPRIKKLLGDSSILKIEFDHHIGADSSYIGDSGYCLVTEATSASELVGHLVLKLRGKKELLAEYQIEDPFTRNLVLAILSGIIGDTNMGQFLKSRRERRYYRLFSSMLNEMLAEATLKETNFKSIGEVYTELQRLSSKEDTCFSYFTGKKQFSDSVGFVALDEEDMSYLFSICDEETVVTVARAIANDLAEESGVFSLVAYYDNPEQSDLIQFRVRRSQSFKAYDLRNLLQTFNIENGGGHEGAIGFRMPRGLVADYGVYIQGLITGLEKAAATKPV